MKGESQASISRSIDADEERKSSRGTGQSKIGSGNASEDDELGLYSFRYTYALAL